MSKSQNDDGPYYLQVLRREFQRRIQKNNRLSLRSFAARLEVHPSALSRVMSGQQDLSRRAALLVTKKLELDAEETRKFMQSVLLAHHERETREVSAELQTADLRPTKAQVLSGEDVASRLATPLCLALRELFFTRGFRSEPAWMADRLGAPVQEIEETLRAMVEGGWLSVEEGQYRPSHHHVSAVNTNETTELRRKLQKAMLERASASLDHEPFERRAHYSMTMAADPQKMQFAHKMIQEFMDALCDVLETGDRDEVYQLSVQLVPMTQTSGQNRAG